MKTVHGNNQEVSVGIFKDESKFRGKTLVMLHGDILLSYT